jgi:prolactin regulatory element-binding protein
MGKKRAAADAERLLAHCTIPAYCLRVLGDRHLLVAGGGGSAKTGVRNEIQVF